MTTPLSFKTIIGVLFASLLLSSCGMQQKFASRKYTKGFFADAPSTVPVPKSVNTNRAVTATNATSVSTQNTHKEQNITEASKPVETNIKERQLPVSQTPRKLSTTQPENNSPNSPYTASVERSVNGNGGTHATTSNGEGKNKYGAAALLCVLLSLAIIILTVGPLLSSAFELLLLIILSPLAPFLLLIAGALASLFSATIASWVVILGAVCLILDIASVVLAIMSISRNEPKRGFAKAVLIYWAIGLIEISLLLKGL